jgi:polysaccharide biosynthesis transport protein
MNTAAQSDWGARPAEMPLSGFLRLLWSRRGLFSLVAAAVLALTALLLWVWPPSYTASTRVLLEMGRSREALTDASMPSLLTQGYIGTQVDIIRSERVAKEAVKSLGIASNEVAREMFLRETGGRGSIEQFFAERLADRIKVRPAQQSNIVEIAFKAPDPKFAADAANAVARAYIATQVDLRVKPAREFTEFFNQQAQSVRQRFEVAQRKLSEYQRKHGITSVDERLDVESNRLQELSTQLTQMQAVRSESGEKAGSAARVGTSSALPDVLNNPVVAQLKAEIARAESKLAELQGQFGPRYPLVERGKDELEGLRRQLKQQSDAVGGSFSRQHEVNLARESEIRTELDRQRKKVLDLKRQRDEMGVLVRDVESTQRSLDQITQRLLQHTVESESRGANVVQLDPAVEPLKPSSPNVLVVSLVGLVLAPMIATLIVGIASVLDRRAVSAEDIETAMGCPVIARVPRSKKVSRSDAPSLVVRLRSTLRGMRPLLPSPRT